MLNPDFYGASGQGSGSQEHCHQAERFARQHGGEERQHEYQAAEYREPVTGLTEEIGVEQDHGSARQRVGIRE